MAKVFFILTYTPDPRLLRRMRSFLKYNFQVGLIFTERTHPVNPFIRNNLSKVYNFVFYDADTWTRRLYEIGKFFIKANKIINKEKPDIIYISAFDSLMMNYIGRWQERAVILYEISDLPGGRWRRNKIYMLLIDRLEKLFIKRVDRIILTSPYFYPEKYQGHKAGILLVENLPERRLFDKYKKAKHKDFTVGFFGLIRHKKSLETLINALGGVNGVKVLIAGRGARGDEIYRDIVKLSLKYDNIEFKGSYDYESDIVGLYSSIDCVYSVYDADDENTNLALGNKLYEAVVCGLPILVTEGSKMAEFVESNGIGIAVAYDRQDEVKEAILQLMNNKELLKNIENACYLLREKYFYETKEEKLMTEILNATKQKIAYKNEG